MFQDFKEVFSSIDKDGDGLPSIEELRLAVHNIEIEVSTIIKEGDFNGNGFINYNEFLIAKVDKQAASNKVQLKQVFQSFDINGDGKIDLNELQSILGTSGTSRSVIV
jgi:calcium-dependent protein kinase